MCGRYTLFQTEELADRFRISRTKDTDVLLKELKKRYNIAPSQLAPTVRLNDDGERQLAVMRWGYMPFWAKDIKDIFKYKTFNARSEEIFEKRTWKDAIRYRRCLIPSTGFYEWKKVDDGKRPYFIHPDDQGLFSFAGVWGEWRDSEGHTIDTYSIITTAANDQMATIHSRMPVILHSDEEGEWLNPDYTEPEQIAPLMKPYKDDGLDIFEVSRDVNTAKNENDRLILPMNSK